MSDGGLLAKLRGPRADADREKYGGAVSAGEAVSRRPGLHDRDAGWI
jgi:hypothetical protein